MKNIYHNENSIIFKNDFFDFETGSLISPVETQNYFIVQVADSYYNSHFDIPNHLQHCDIEITFTLTNSILCATNNGEFQKVNKHEVYISFKNDIHALEGKRGGRFQTLALNFKNEMNFKLLESIKKKFREKRICNLNGAESVFADIISEFVTTKLSFSAQYLDGLITMLLVKLIREGETLPKIDVLSTHDILPAIINYIDSHFLDIYSLEELSEHFGYNYSHICKTFSKRYGITPKEYLINKKMDYAITLLMDGKSVKDTSEKLGYSTPYNFSRAFKKHYKLSPVKYRNLT